jgi:hypothetical protein
MFHLTSLRQACNGLREARRGPGTSLGRCCICSPLCSEGSSRTVHVRWGAAIAMDTMDLTFAPTDLHRRFPELTVTSLADILAGR